MSMLTRLEGESMMLGWIKDLHRTITMIEGILARNEEGGAHQGSRQFVPVDTSSSIISSFRLKLRVLG